MLSFINVTIRLKENKRTIVHPFSYEVGEGKSVAIVGESGAGKSSLLYSILNLLDVDFNATGSILFKGRDLLKTPENLLQKIRGHQVGLVFQNCAQSFDPMFKVGLQLDNLIKLYYPEQKKIERKKKAGSLLQSVELTPVEKILNLYPSELSGGMIQRLAIAFAIAASPKLLLADELTSALDKKVEDQVMELLLSLVRKNKMSFLWITHDLHLAQKYADEIIVMREGKVVEAGTPKAIMQSPQELYTCHLVNSIPEGVRGAF